MKKEAKAEERWGKIVDMTSELWVELSEDGPSPGNPFPELELFRDVVICILLGSGIEDRVPVAISKKHPDIMTKVSAAYLADVEMILHGIIPDDLPEEEA